LTELLGNNDIVCVHVSFLPENKLLIGKKEIDSMKPGSYLINLSRGGIVDEEALYEALKNNYLAGATVDVFNKEPYEGPLTELDNIVLTPHIGSYAKESRLEMEIQAVNNLLEVIDS
jgi:D-3-phosphoglycerate dehydrogenase